MNAPWPKLSTSIRPNTSVRPEATMKMIIPIASPATVNVTHVDGEPISGNAISATSGTNSTGTKSRRCTGSDNSPRAVIGADPDEGQGADVEDRDPLPAPPWRPRAPPGHCP